ncbi:P-loop containing nucleoside triphosphate hydrolase protein [Fennellomyces sp. T-0311]|nr:P-loop containing nucleoside triphosphate hydrolase protein [Fennellomyces sp. T-0311]
METSHCHCHKPAKHLMTKKEGPNKGRWFYTCESRACKFFHWDDTTPRSRDLGGGHTVGDTVKPKKALFWVVSPAQIRFRVKCSRQLVEDLRSVATHDINNASWSIPATQEAYQNVIRVIRKEILDTDVEQLPSNFVHVLPKKEDEPNQTDSTAKQEPDERLQRVMDTELWQVLKEFQRKGVAEGVARNGRMLLGDEMGLGKTIQAIAIAVAYSDEWPVLVVCPSSLRLTWKGEIIRWLGLEKHEIQVITKGTDMDDLAQRSNNTTLNIINDDSGRKRRKLRAEARDVKFWITSYDLATRGVDCIEKANFNFIICDESHYIKAMNTKRTKALAPVLKKSKHTLLLSGTPAFSRPSELFTQVSALRSDIFPNYHSFGARYCSSSYGAYGKVYQGAQNLVELNMLLSRSVMVRRLKDDVGLELPPKTRQTVLIDIASLKAMKKFADLMGDMQVAIDNAGSDEHLREEKKSNKQQMLLEWYTETATAKIPAVREYLTDLLESTQQKIIVFAYHRPMMDAIESCVSKLGIGYIRIDGSTKTSIRQQLCDQFQAPDSETQVAILSIPIGVGLTLMCFAELYWTPSQLLQAEDRAHRIGRVGPVNIVYILAMDTIDQVLWPMVKKKLRIISTTIDGAGGKVSINEDKSSVPRWLCEEDAEEFMMDDIASQLEE